MPHDLLSNAVISGRGIADGGVIPGAPGQDPKPVCGAFRTPRKATDTLPVGTQAKLVAASLRAQRIGAPLTHLLTIRRDALIHCGSRTAVLGHHPSEATAHFIELLRKWLARRDLPPVYLWVREVNSREGEHLHVAFHMSPRHREGCIAQCSVWFDTAMLHLPPTRSDYPEGGLARSEFHGVFLSKETRGRTSVRPLAEYLGKGEPDEIPKRGRMIRNPTKTRLNHIPQGRIEGTRARHNLFGISRSVKD